MESSSSVAPSSPAAAGGGAPFEPNMLKPAIATILRGADRSSVSAKAVRKELQNLYPGIDIASHKAAVTELIVEAFNASQGDDDNDQDASPSSDPSTPGPSPKPKSKPTSYKIPKVKSERDGGGEGDAELAQKLAYELNGPAKTTRGGSAGKPRASWGRKEKKVKTKSRARVDSDDDSAADSDEPKKKKKASGGGYNQPLRLSAELAALCGGEDVMSRPQVVKQVWKHIKANDLQNPNDRREIICDEVMRRVIPKNRVTMFEMNKYFGPHLYPFEGEVKADVVDSAPDSD